MLRISGEVDTLNIFSVGETSSDIMLSRIKELSEKWHKAIDDAQNNLSKLLGVSKESIKKECRREAYCFEKVGDDGWEVKERYFVGDAVIAELRYQHGIYRMLAESGDANSVWKGDRRLRSQLGNNAIVKPTHNN